MVNSQRPVIKQYVVPHKQIRSCRQRCYVYVGWHNSCRPLSETAAAAVTDKTDVRWLRYP